MVGLAVVWLNLLGYFVVMVFGIKRSSDFGSNLRRAGSRVTLFLAIILVLAIFFRSIIGSEANLLILGISGYLLSGYGLAFFCICVLFMPLRDHFDFRVDTSRLMRDTLVSSFFLIVSTSYIFQFHGISPGGKGTDFLYFSAVTFSTLGYGDFKPTESARLVAAAHALIGNLHLGMLVGSTFASLNRS
jgi:hypothetical protein